MLRTPFWKQAAQSLPKGVRGRYLADFEQAERVELALDAVFEACAWVRHALSGPALKPRPN